MHICTNSWRTTSPLAFSFWCDALQSWQVELGSAVPGWQCLPACPAPPLPLSAICGCWQLAQKSGMGRWSLLCWSFPVSVFTWHCSDRDRALLGSLTLPWQKRPVTKENWIPEVMSSPTGQGWLESTICPNRKILKTSYKKMKIWDKTGIFYWVKKNSDQLCFLDGFVCYMNNHGVVMSRRWPGYRGRAGVAPAVRGKGAEGKALPPALGSKSVHTGVAGELRLRKS